MQAPFLLPLSWPIPLGGHNNKEITVAAGYTFLSLTKNASAVAILLRDPFSQGSIRITNHQSAKAIVCELLLTALHTSTRHLNPSHHDATPRN